jgi:hypothetical protein
MAIVLEVPNELIGEGQIGAWASTSLFGHAPRGADLSMGLPTNHRPVPFEPVDTELTAKYHARVPSQDEQTKGPAIAALTA